MNRRLPPLPIININTASRKNMVYYMHKLERYRLRYLKSSYSRCITSKDPWAMEVQDLRTTINSLRFILQKHADKLQK